MGVDFIDVVFRLERRFGVRLDPDEHFYLLRTGWIHFLVWEKLHGRSPPCPDFSAVYRDVLRIAGHQPPDGFWRRLFRHRRVAQDAEFLRQLDDLGYSRPPPDLTLAHHVAAWIAFTDRDRAPQKERARPAAVPPRAEVWTQESVWEAIRKELEGALSIDAESITPESWLMEDLGAN